MNGNVALVLKTDIEGDEVAGNDLVESEGVGSIIVDVLITGLGKVLGENSVEDNVLNGSNYLDVCRAYRYVYLALGCEEREGRTCNKRYAERDSYDSQDKLLFLHIIIYSFYLTPSPRGEGEI